ncbi:hypothetical protein EW145_g8421, partial [Phellinidium pouzarii]
PEKRSGVSGMNRNSPHVKYDEAFSEGRYVRADKSKVDNDCKTCKDLMDRIIEKGKPKHINNKRQCTDRNKNIGTSNTTSVADSPSLDPAPTTGSLQPTGLSPAGVSLGNPSIDSAFHVSLQEGDGDSLMQMASPPNIWKPSSELKLYQPILSLLAHISLHVYRSYGDDKPLAVQCTEEEAQAIVDQDSTKVPISARYHAADVRSFAEVKNTGVIADGLITQICRYAESLPHARPNIAGLLFLACDARDFCLYWSDPSRVVSSLPFTWREDCDHLFYFFDTLYRPLDDLPQSDPTIVPSPKDDGKEERMWKVDTQFDKTKVLLAERLNSTPGLGKHTWVVKSDPYVIKYIWRDKGRRFTEGQALERIHSDGIVPGIARLVDYSKVMITGDDKATRPLETSKKHSHVRRCLKANDGNRNGHNKLPCIDIPLSDNEDKTIFSTDDGRDVHTPVKHSDDIAGPMDLQAEKDNIIDGAIAGGAPADNDSSMLVPTEATDGPAEGVPSATTHDKAPEMLQEGTRIPQREKTRTILESYGDKLEECTSLLQLLKVAFDIVQSEQMLIYPLKCGSDTYSRMLPN